MYKIHNCFFQSGQKGYEQESELFITLVHVVKAYNQCEMTLPTLNLQISVT